ncbi:wall-associated receptor kinase 5-like protein, partial [Tanacetum coccineum]
MQIAGTFSCMHSYISTRIVHKDIKHGNILVNESYKAMSFDPGLLRSMPLSRTHLTTQNDGTFGYLDVKYFRSRRFTTKSNVYAFDVVPKELLTKRKYVASIDSDEGL